MRKRMLGILLALCLLIGLMPMAAMAADELPTITGVKVVDGTDGFTPVTQPVYGQKLAANIQTSTGEIGTYPVNEDATYKWYYKESTDTVLGTEPVYTVTSDNSGKTICVDVSVEGYEGTATWTAEGVAVSPTRVTGVSVVDGTDGFTPVTAPVVGQKLYANISISTQDEVIGVYPVDENATYKWYYKESPDQILGTEGAYTVTSDNDGKTICVEVSYKDYEGSAVWTASSPVTFGLPFTDVDTDAWYEASVAYAYENGLLVGTTDTTFAPNMPTSRAMFVAVLYRMSGEEAKDAEYTFEDVNPKSYYAEAVAWAVQNKIVYGYNEKEFAPNDDVTREQAACFLYRYAQYKKLDVSDSADLSEFGDAAQVSGWAENAMKWACGTNLLVGDEDANLMPQGNAERCQVAALMTRFCKNIAK